MINTDTLQDGRLGDAELRRQTKPVQRILVADDDQDMRRLVADSLAGCGYEVDAAEDGAIAWTALQATHYDLLITDNSMPKVTGLGLVKMLHDHAVTLPVIMATGAPPTDELERCPWLRISAIVPKPYAIKDLLETVKKTLHDADSTADKLQCPLISDTKNVPLPVVMRTQEEPAPRL
jgi:two-component system cell cycle response regulator CpdR